MKSRNEASALDAADPLAALRDQFDLPPGLVYLDGNSLGVMPKAAPARVQQVVTQEWGRGLIGSWSSAGWMELAPRIGDKIARLIGAGAGECVATDSTSVNLFKVLHSALAVTRAVKTRSDAWLWLATLLSALAVSIRITGAAVPVAMAAYLLFDARPWGLRRARFLVPLAALVLFAGVAAWVKANQQVVGDLSQVPAAPANRGIPTTT